jgi:hypothetical protein
MLLSFRPSIVRYVAGVSFSTGCFYRVVILELPGGGVLDGDQPHTKFL